MSETVRCRMGDDYYEGPYFYESPDGDYEVPRDLFDKWEEAESAWKSAQTEIVHFMAKNPRPPTAPSKIGSLLADVYSDQIFASLRPLPDWIKNAGH